LVVVIMLSVPSSRDVELPREGESIIQWAHAITRKVNRRIVGPNVVDGPLGDVLILDSSREAKEPSTDSDLDLVTLYETTGGTLRPYEAVPIIHRPGSETDRVLPPPVDRSDYPTSNAYGECSRFAVPLRGIAAYGSGLAAVSGCIWCPVLVKTDANYDGPGLSWYQYADLPLASEVGDDGDLSGLGFDAWVSETAYEIGDTVTYGGTIYVCTEANSDEVWDAEKWEDQPSISGLVLRPYGAAQILWRAGGSGTADGHWEWALVRLGTPSGQQVYTGYLLEELDDGTGAQAMLTSTNRQKVYDFLLDDSGNLPPAALIVATYFPDQLKFYVTAAKCSPYEPI
jgi:hypothetical protein